jgi:hypothetical protein
VSSSVTNVSYAQHKSRCTFIHQQLASNLSTGAGNNNDNNSNSIGNSSNNRSLFDCLDVVRISDILLFVIDVSNGLGNNAIDEVFYFFLKIY